MHQTNIILTLALGLAILCGVQWFVSRRRAQAEEKVLKGYFLLGLSGLFAKLSMADGTVTDDETALATNVFDSMALSEAEAALCRGNFLAARHAEWGVRDYANRFIAYATPVATEFLYDLLWQLSKADGHIDAKEEALLDEIAQALGLGHEAFVAYKGGNKPNFSPSSLRAAGVPASLIEHVLGRREGI